MRLYIHKEINRLRYIAKRLFKRQNFDFNKEDYHNYVPFHDNGLFAKTETIKKLVKEYRLIFRNSNPLIMLDIGCGTGEIDEIIHHDFNKVIGADASVGAIRKANIRNLNNGRFLVSNAERLCFSDGFFDFVMLANCLHHSYKSIRVIIQESLRVLKKDGLLLVFELNSLNPLQLIWFNLFSPVDKGMKMVSPMRLKRIVTEAADSNGSIKIKPLPLSFYFEYMLIYSKTG